MNNSTAVNDYDAYTGGPLGHGGARRHRSLRGLVVNGYEPYLGQGSVAGSLAALRHMRAAGARSYLPGHGPAGQLGPEGEDLTARYCAWNDEHTAAGIARAEGRRSALPSGTEYAAQRDGVGGVRFELKWPGFLEEGVGTAKKEQLAATA